jgi:hypothetical protein
MSAGPGGKARVITGTGESVDHAPAFALARERVIAVGAAPFDQLESIADDPVPDQRSQITTDDHLVDRATRVW